MNDFRGGPKRGSSSGPRRDSSRRNSSSGPRRDSSSRDSSSGPRTGFGPKQMHKATCAECGRECEVPFKPREGRDVFCKECFSKKRKY